MGRVFRHFGAAALVDIASVVSVLGGSVGRQLVFANHVHVRCADLRGTTESVGHLRNGERQCKSAKPFAEYDATGVELRQPAGDHKPLQTLRSTTADDTL